MKTKLIITALFVLAGVAYSCTDLSETVRDTALGQEVLEQPDAPEQTLAPVYAGMQNLMASHNWLNNLQSISSYEQITPFRGGTCLLYTSPSPRDGLLSRMPSSA